MSSHGRRTSVSPSFLALAALFAVLTPIGGCSSKSTAVAPVQDASPTDTPPATVTKFQPQGCGYTVAAVDSFPAFDVHADVGSGAPKHVRLGLGGQVEAGAAGYADPSTSFAVVWQTDDATTASKIKWGESDTALSSQSTGVSYVIEPEFGSASKDGNRFHEAHVCGLQPGRTYYYQVGGGAAGSEQWSKVNAVTTAPAKTATDPVLIGVAGDTRDNGSDTPLPVWKAISGRFKNSGAHVAVFSGDFVYTGGDQNLWDTWSTASDDTSGTVFFAMAPGNHENELLSYFAHVTMPGAVGQNYERYYSFDYGPVHVVTFDDYDGIITPSIDSTNYKAELLAWLDADLKKADANRANVPWVVTVHHHGVFSSTSHTDRATERAAMVAAVQPLYDKYKLDLDIAAHDHFYERSKPMIGATPAATGGTTYVICGGGGAPHYTTIPGNAFSAKIQEYDEATQGLYGIVTATKTSFTLKAYQLATATGTSPADDTVIDTLQLTR
jgi:hypothetical protein